MRFATAAGDGGDACALNMEVQECISGKRQRCNTHARTLSTELVSSLRFPPSLGRASCKMLGWRLANALKDALVTLFDALKIFD